MGVVAVLISVFFLILSIYLNKNKPLNPIVLFFSLWSLVLFLSVLNLYNLYKPSDEAYFLILLMLIFVFAGSLAVHLPKINMVSGKIHKEKKEVGVNFYILSIGMIIYILFAMLACLQVLKLYFEGVPLWQIRNWSLQAYGSDNPLANQTNVLGKVFQTTVLSPFYSCVPPIVAYYFFAFNKTKKRYFLLFLSLVCLLLSSLSGGGGRLRFIYYIGCFLLAFFAVSNNELFSKFNKRKYKKYLGIFLVFAMVAVVIITRMRTGAGNFLKQFYTYFALAPTLLSTWLPEIKEVPHTWGMLTFFGIHSYFFRGLDMMGFDFLVPEIYDSCYQHILNAEVFKNLGFGIGNAFVTPIYYFYIDGGYLFVCLASLFFGSYINRFHKVFVNNINIKSFTYYALIMYGVFLTFMRIQTCIPGYWLSFLMASFLLHPLKKET